MGATSAARSSASWLLWARPLLWACLSLQLSILGMILSWFWQCLCLWDKKFPLADLHIHSFTFVLLPPDYKVYILSPMLFPGSPRWDQFFLAFLDRSLHFTSALPSANHQVVTQPTACTPANVGVTMLRHVYVKELIVHTLTAFSFSFGNTVVVDSWWQLEEHSALSPAKVTK